MNVNSTTTTSAPPSDPSTGVALVSATGMLGSGFREESITAALDLGAVMIGCDAGSTDAGPNALATGRPMFSRPAVKRDTEVLLRLAVGAGVPLIIGSAGMGGGRSNLDWLLEIVHEVAAEGGLHFKLATIDSEQSKATIRELNGRGRVRPLPPAGPLTDAEIDDSIHIVAMMGVEPIQAALREGADVIVTGRSSDPSIYAAIPLMRGYSPAITWHAAKILECGAAAVALRTAPDSMFGVVREDEFDIWPLRDDFRCTPQSIAAHSFYETSDPFTLYEPGGALDLRQATYTALDDRTVRVQGAGWVPADDYTVKLEGARLAGYSTIVLGAVRDPLIIAELDDWLAGLDESLKVRLGNVFPGVDYEIVLRVYGRDGVMGALEPTPTVTGHEVALMWDVISDSQEISHSIAASIAHMALHHPIPRWRGLITGLAFPFSPAEVDRGPVYEFHLNHVALPDTPVELFATTYEEV